MKIGLVLDDTLDTPDGVQQYVLVLGRWLTARGHEVHYLVGHTTRTDIRNIHSLSRNLKVRFNGNRMSMPLPASRRRLRSLLKQEQFDILHIQVPYSPFMAGRLLRLAPRHTAIVGTFHVLPYGTTERAANTLLALFNRRSSKRFQIMIAASEPAADFAASCYGFKAIVIPHPFNYANFAVKSSPSEDTNIVYMARLVERKGALWLLRAVAELHRRQSLPDKTRIFIGGRGPLLPKLQAYAKSQGIGDRLEFSGFVAEDVKAQYLAQADIAVFPSISGESFGISIIEALAAARGVVIAGDNPGYRAAMPAEEQLLDPTDTRRFADILEHWLANPKLRAQAATRQKAYARQFDEGVICSRVELLYKQALQTQVKS